MNVGTLDEWARRQLGLVTSRQLTLLGWSEKRISRASKSGELFPLRRGVFRLRGVALTRQVMWMAAVLAAGEGAQISHVTAAEHWGFRGFEADKIDILGRCQQPIRIDGVRGHRSLWLPDRDVTILHRIPVTSPSRTLIDAASAVPFEVLNRALSDGLRRKLISKPRLLRTFELMPQRGRRSNAAMRHLLASWIPGYDPRSSDREQDVLDTLASAGVPLPVQQHGVHIDGITYLLDFLARGSGSDQSAVTPR